MGLLGATLGEDLGGVGGGRGGGSSRFSLRVTVESEHERCQRHWLFSCE